MLLTIGACRLNNTDGIVRVRGNPQISLEWGPLYSELLLTMDLYGAGGRRVARLRRNQWTFNDDERFACSTHARGVSLLDTKVSQVALEAQVVGPDSVVITQGAFFSAGGHEIEITAEDWSEEAGTAASANRPTQPTSPPFAPDEIVAIREAVLASGETITCPQCACPLAIRYVTGAARQSSFLVHCIMCRRNLVVHSQS